MPKSAAAETAPQEKDAWSVWVDENPLRAWRRETKRPILQTAAQIKASMTSIQLWERGVHKPGEDHMAAIATLIGDEGIDARWDEWKSRQPTQ